ncbi:hypothetical protein EPI10_024217 [Gossypium australe]|uniref:Uncharacterized protein n=1 Tax=Gossypium australe TaxID=47621 RepID=A0A5B6VY27_9ROSI|nr:hypothetical protein EPI10_024217 [Gossypium australe]
MKGKHVKRGEELAIDGFLQSFLNSFRKFALSFNMNEINKNFPHLLNMLRIAESNMKNCWT